MALLWNPSSAYLSTARSYHSAAPAESFTFAARSPMRLKTERSGLGSRSDSCSLMTSSHAAMAALASFASRPRAFSFSFSRSEEHTSELQSRSDLVCRLLLEKKKKKTHEKLHRA